MLALTPSELTSRTTTSIISNEETNDCMKIIKSLEKSGLLIKGLSKTNKNEAKQKKQKKKCRLLSMLLGTFGASLLGDLLIGKDTIIAAEER